MNTLTTTIILAALFAAWMVYEIMNTPPPKEGDEA